MKPISKSIIETCEALERGGPMTAVQIGEALCASRDSARFRTLSAARSRLVAINRSVWPHEVKVVPGWRGIVAKRKAAVEVEILARNFSNLKIEYAARPRIVGPVAGTVWQGLGV